MPTTSQTKNYFIQTFGCQMNKADSEHLKGVLESINMTECDVPEAADVIIVNTCSIRQTAEDRVFSMMHNYGKLKLQKPDLIIGITGCMVGHDTKKEFLKKLPMVDLYFPIRDVDVLPQKITELKYNMVSDQTVSDSPIAYLETPAKYSSTFEAYVPIMSGCNKFCTFCIVPYSRGREISRNGKNILAEVQRLKDKGYQMVTFVGQNVNSYHPADEFRHKNNPYQDNFAALLWEVNRIGIPWVHFTAPHPRDMADEVIDALTLPCMVNFLHLPLQSGDDAVLQKMNRQYTGKDYLNLVDKIRKKRPKIALGTDLIIGFPGETDEQFQNTVDMYKEVDFDISYSAIYSPRKHTPAAKMKNQVPLVEKKKRWQTLQELMEKTTERKNKHYQDQTVEVLVKEDKKSYLVGETRELKKITLTDSKAKVGEVVKAKVDKTSTWMLYGKTI